VSTASQASASRTFAASPSNHLRSRSRPLRPGRATLTRRLTRLLADLPPGGQAAIANPLRFSAGLPGTHHTRPHLAKVSPNY
jgi:hypothetical protein